LSPSTRKNRKKKGKDDDLYGKLIKLGEQDLGEPVSVFGDASYTCHITIYC
jgi:hypothetical protein